MKVPTAVSLLVLPFAACQAATITLYGIETDTVVETGIPAPSRTIGAIGTADGHTTYHEHIVNSVFVEKALNGGAILTGSGTTFTGPPASTRTYTSDPLTVDATIVADASHIVINQDSPKSGWTAASLSCDLDGKGGGACVQAYWVPGEPTGTTSYTGSAVPIATFITEGGKHDEKGNGAIAVSRGGSALSVMFMALLAPEPVSVGNTREETCYATSNAFFQEKHVT